MSTLVKNPIKKVRGATTEIRAGETEVESEKRFIKDEFDLFIENALEDGIDVRENEQKGGSALTTPEEVNELISCVGDNQGIVITIRPDKAIDPTDKNYVQGYLKKYWINEGPVEVTHIAVIKRRDQEEPDDQIFTYFLMDVIQNPDGTEDLKGALLVNEIKGVEAEKEVTIRFDAATGSWQGRHAFKKGEDRQLQQGLEQSACDNDLREAVDTLGMPVVEVVEQVTKEFDQIRINKQSRLAVANEAIRAARNAIASSHAGDTVQVDSLAT